MKKKLFLYVKALSDFGTFMDLIVLNVVVYAATGSAAWLAATMAARTLGGVLSSLFSGVVADRFNRRKIMIASDIIRVVIILLLIPFPSPMMIIVGSFLIGACNSFFMVSFSAEIPQIFGQNKILEVNSLIARLTSISLVAGFIAAGILTDWIGYELTLLIDAGTYLLSTYVLLKLKWETTPARVLPITDGMKQKITAIGSDLKEVVKYLVNVPLLLLLNIVFLVGAFAGSSHNLGIPLLAEIISPDQQSFYYGMIWGVWGLGSILATLTLPRIKWLKDQKLFLAAFGSAILMSTGFMIFLSSINLYVILSFAFFTGIFDACFTTLHATTLQKSENHIRGRIFGVGMLLKSVGFAIGFIVAPIVLKYVTMSVMVWLFHGFFVMITLLALVISCYLIVKEKEKKSIKLPVQS